MKEVVHADSGQWEEQAGNCPGFGPFPNLLPWVWLSNFLVTSTCNTHDSSKYSTVQPWWLGQHVLPKRRYTLQNCAVTQPRGPLFEQWALWRSQNLPQNHWVSGRCPSSGILNTRKHNVSDQWLMLALSKGHNCVGVNPPSPPEDGNRSSFSRRAF
jgi:hypothetical protein